MIEITDDRGEVWTVEEAQGQVVLTSGDSKHVHPVKCKEHQDYFLAKWCRDAGYRRSCLASRQGTDPAILEKYRQSPVEERLAAAIARLNAQENPSDADLRRLRGARPIRRGLGLFSEEHGQIRVALGPRPDLDTCDLAWRWVREGLRQDLAVRKALLDRAGKPTYEERRREQVRRQANREHLELQRLKEGL